MMTRVALARLVLEMLATQQRYFKTRSNDVLLESKRLEKRLKEVCEDIVEGPSLFEEAR